MAAMGSTTAGVVPLPKRVKREADEEEEKNEEEKEEKEEEEEEEEEDEDAALREVRDGSRVLLGAAWHAESKRLLKRHAVTAVLTVADDEVVATAQRAPGVVYCNVAIADDVDADLAQVLPAALAFIAGVRALPRGVLVFGGDHPAAQLALGGTVLVASPRGHSRAPAVCAAYLMQHGGLRLRAALDCVTTARPTARVNVGFFEALQRLEAQLHGAADAAPSVTLADYRRTQVRLWSGPVRRTEAHSSDSDDE